MVKDLNRKLSAMEDFLKRINNTLVKIDQESSMDGHLLMSAK